MIDVEKTARDYVVNEINYIQLLFDEYPEQALELRDALIEEFASGIKSAFTNWCANEDTFTH